MIKRLLRRIQCSILGKQEGFYSPLSPALPLPKGVSEQQLFEFVTSVRPVNSPEEEMRAYGTQDFRRFVYTLGLAQGINGKCLELGANPYFTTMLLREFTKLEVVMANYFGSSNRGLAHQGVTYREMRSNNNMHLEFEYHHFNVETDKFPFLDEEFDLVIFAEILEHLLIDPCIVLREIKRVLKPGGVLILTTPNVTRLENVARIIAGANIYDPYSGYGPYGRHNREYNRHELIQLLKYEGFEPEVQFTADVHANKSAHYNIDLNKLSELIKFRDNDLGQYLFVKAKNTNSLAIKRPSWLYRSFPQGQLD